MVNGVSLNSFLAAAQQNPDGNVRLSSDGTDVKATNSFFKKAVNWMTGNNHQTRAVFAQALADKYGADAAQFAFDQAGGGGFLSSSRGDQLSALEVNALNLYAQVKAQELSSPGQIPDVTTDRPTAPVANSRGRNVDPPSLNSLQRGPTTRSHAPLTNRQSLMESGIESPQSTPISPAAKELARESAIDRLGQIESSSDAVAAFNDQKADLRQDLEAAVGKFGCDDIMRRLEATTTHNPKSPNLFKDTAKGALGILRAAKDNYALPFAKAAEKFPLDSALTTADSNAKSAHTALDAASKALNEARGGSDQTKISDAEQVYKNARDANTEAQKAVANAKEAINEFNAKYADSGSSYNADW